MDSKPIGFKKMKFLFFLTAKFAKTSQSNAKSDNPFSAALCGYFAIFAVKVYRN
jgi:hypothetical protein